VKRRSVLKKDLTGPALLEMDDLRFVGRGFSRDNKGA
jgi:hypothetical protein